MPMGVLDEGHFNGELENGVKMKMCLEEEQTSVTMSTIQDSVKVLLEGLGEDYNREGIRKTPLRVAKALLEGTRGYRQKVKDIVQGALFPEAGLDNAVGHAGGAGGLVVVRDLNLFSTCESCLLPIQVRCHVGYVPSGERVVGLSKLSRVADVFAKRLQEPQRLADEVCLGLQNGFKPAGVAVVLQCWHIQSPEMEKSCTDATYHPSKHEMQGWLNILVRSGSGVLENENGEAWNDFLVLLKFRGIEVDKIHSKSFTSHRWCPSRPIEAVSDGNASTKNHSIYKVSAKTEPANPAMIKAVTMMLQSLGEDPCRKELIGTPHRFVQWLMNFKYCNLETKFNGFDYGRSLKLDLQRDMNNQEEMRSELNFPLRSLCEHHLLPFHGVVHIGYFQTRGSEPIKRSILHSIVHFYGCKLQVQERLSRQIAETVSSAVGGDVIVVAEANHICMISRGIEKVGSSTATIAALGRFSTEATAKAAFLKSISNSTSSGG